MHKQTELVFLACRRLQPNCVDEYADGLENLLPAIRAGWDNIVEDSGGLYPLPSHWWTHMGTCPKCLKLETETTRRPSRRSGLTRLFRTPY